MNGSVLVDYNTSSGNDSSAPLEFTLICFPEVYSWNISGPLIFFLIVALVSNMTLLVVIYADPRLHHPMYYFLAMLAVAGILHCTSCTPRVLLVLCSGISTIPAAGCFSQMFFYTMWSASESSIFLVMAYDRYVAICHPLHYPSIITNQLVLKASAFIVIRNLAVALPPPLLAAGLDYCSGRSIPHCFCESMSVEKLSCSDYTSSSVFGVVSFVMVGGTDLLLIIISYSVILRTIVAARSFHAASKAFRTCGSHLILICLFYITIATTIMSSRAVKEVPRPVHVLLALVHQLLPPSLNPLVYGILTKEIRHAMKRLLGKVKIYP